MIVWTDAGRIRDEIEAHLWEHLTDEMADDYFIVDGDVVTWQDEESSDILFRGKRFALEITVNVIEAS